MGVVWLCSLCSSLLLVVLLWFLCVGLSFGGMGWMWVVLFGSIAWVWSFVCFFYPLLVYLCRYQTPRCFVLVIGLRDYLGICL